MVVAGVQVSSWCLRVVRVDLSGRIRPRSSFPLPKALRQQRPAWESCRSTSSLDVAAPGAPPAKTGCVGASNLSVQYAQRIRSQPQRRGAKCARIALNRGAKRRSSPETQGNENKKPNPYAQKAAIRPLEPPSGRKQPVLRGIHFQWISLPRRRHYFSVRLSEKVFKIGLVRYRRTVFLPVLISTVTVMPG